MANQIIINLPDTPETLSLIEALLKTPGVTVSRGIDGVDEWLTLAEGAKMAKVHYLTFRSWVVDQGRIPFRRFSDSPKSKGDIRIRKSDVQTYLNGPIKKKRPGRKTNEVKII